MFGQIVVGVNDRKGGHDAIAVANGPIGRLVHGSTCCGTSGARED